MAISLGTLVAGADSPPIDREALVTRHNLEVTKPGAMQVGNGEFAFTADVTGLQSLGDACTMSQWGWHSTPLPAGQTISDFQWTPKQTYGGRSVEYMIGAGDPISQWLYANPHRLNLGRIGFCRQAKGRAPLKASDIVHPRRTLDLWNGFLNSQFELDGQPVRVELCCHPELDAVAVRIQSPLLASSRLAVELAFPYPDLKEFGGRGDWSKPGAHETQMTTVAPTRADFSRKLDGTEYHVGLSFAPGASVRERKGEKHRYVLSSEGAERLEFVCAFAPEALPAMLPGVEETFAACRDHWNGFWRRGGALDLSGSADPRWKELERRVVLSQYLTAVNCAGSLPPQESGLVNNGWNGKFHFEMYWWHGAHFALWDRWPEVKRSLGVYRQCLASAREKAARQGYKGARWPKCTGPEGRESPHPIHAMLLWQQPHPIFFAELDYRAHPERATLEAWREIVFDTADFMASFVTFENEHRCVLGPPIYTVPETTDPDQVYNPAFELTYWRFALQAAQQWRERLGMPREPGWQRVLDTLAPLPEQEGVYLMEEHLPDSYTKWNHNHPSVVGALGVLPGNGVDRETMRQTFQKVMACWQWKQTWGWDFPMLAMTAARLGETSAAVDLLLHPNFDFDERGYPVEGGPWPYFPSSGGLLYAVGMMAGGWDDAPAQHAPGFPQDGQWTVRCEGLKTAP